MTLASQVRTHFLDTYVSPARSVGIERVQVAVSDVSRALGWRQRFPVICSALVSDSFHEAMGVRLTAGTKPCPSSSTVLLYELV